MGPGSDREGGLNREGGVYGRGGLNRGWSDWRDGD